MPSKLRPGSPQRATGMAALGAQLIFVVPGVAALEKPIPLPSAEFLESHHAIIGEIRVDNNNIFDLENPEENKTLYKLANRWHVQTRPVVIARQLLFQSGDPYDVRLLQESERILRTNRYLESAEIVPTDYHDGIVDIEVHTRDVWTLDPHLSISRSGGKNKGHIGLTESNLLGTGTEVELMWKSNVDRDSTMLQVVDNQLGSTRYGISATYFDTSDGKGYDLRYGKPFYALDVNRANGLLLSANERIDTLYDRGLKMAEWHHDQTHHEAMLGSSAGLVDGWATRWTGGLVYDEHYFDPVEESTLPGHVLPEDRKFVYPFIGYERVQDRFEEAVNRDQIGRIEDRFLGTRFAVRLGLATTALGSFDDALLIEASANRGFGSSEKNSLVGRADLSSRWTADGVENMKLGLDVAYHRRHSQRRLLYAGLSGIVGMNLDLDQLIELGGDTGLRGYPLRYQVGESSALLTVEERFFTDWYPWHLFRVGGAIFADVGRTWGENPVGDENLGWLADVGLGLRLGNTHSGTGKILHFDIAFPMNGDSSIDSIQFLFEGKSTF